MRATSLPVISFVFGLGLAACGGGELPVDAGHDAAALDASLPRPRVETSLGVLEGSRVEGSQAFLGIPYAAPPVGAARWRAPAPPEPWSGVRPATRRPARCPQQGLGFDLGGDEDCLYLNVHTPDPRPEGAPVLVWIHGGGFVFGEGLQTDGGTAGDRLAASEGVVVVSFNYRLGSLGFLAHPGLTAAGEPSGNFGLADQVAALEWVQAHIADFGGDPERVTIFGESAGGYSVCAHLVAPASRGLFHAAISQSGLCAAEPRSREEADLRGQTIASALGCEGDDESVLACLREATPSALDEASPGSAFTELSSERGDFPVFDAELYPGPFLERVAAGEAAPVPAIFGWNADEGTLFVMLAEQAGNVADEATYLEVTESLAEAHGLDVTAVRERYPLVTGEDPGIPIAAAIGHSALACPSRRAALAYASHADTYAYFFTFTGADFLLPASRDLGAFHSAEIQYVFGHPASTRRIFREPERPLHRAMASAWASFARGDAPAPEGGPTWPIFDADEERHLELDLMPRAGAAADREACALWDGL